MASDMRKLYKKSMGFSQFNVNLKYGSLHILTCIVSVVKKQKSLFALIHDTFELIPYHVTGFSSTKHNFLKIPQLKHSKQLLIHLLIRSLSKNERNLQHNFSDKFSLLSTITTLTKTC